MYMEGIGKTMENELKRYEKELKHFEAVWKRVSGAKCAAAAAQARGVSLKPGENRSCCRRCRFNQGRR